MQPGHLHRPTFNGNGADALGGVLQQGDVTRGHGAMAAWLA